MSKKWGGAALAAESLVGMVSFLFNMPSNIEIKARAEDFARKRELAERLADGPPETIRQQDTFFPCASGRLKLRRLAADRGELIAYRRDDVAGTKQSDYLLYRTAEPEALRARAGGGAGNRCGRDEDAVALPGRADAGASGRGGGTGDVFGVGGRAGGGSGDGGGAPDRAGDHGGAGGAGGGSDRRARTRTCLPRNGNHAKGLVVPAATFDKPHAEPLACYRTFWPRFWAGFIDGVVLWPVTALAGYLIAPRHGTALFIAGLLIDYCNGWVYSTLMHARYGQTLGKMVAGVVVLNVDEQRYPTLRQAFLRDIGNVVLGLGSLGMSLYDLLIEQQASPVPPVVISRGGAIFALGGLSWLLLELVTMLTNRKRRALHDFIAGTVVVRC